MDCVEPMAVCRVPDIESAEWGLTRISTAPCSANQPTIQLSARSKGAGQAALNANEVFMSQPGEPRLGRREGPAPARLVT